MAASGQHYVLVTSLLVPTGRGLGGTQSGGEEKKPAYHYNIEIIISIQSVASQAY